MWSPGVRKEWLMGGVAGCWTPLEAVLTTVGVSAGREGELGKSTQLEASSPHFKASPLHHGRFEEGEEKGSEQYFVVLAGLGLGY